MSFLLNSGWTWSVRAGRQWYVAYVHSGSVIISFCHRQDPEMRHKPRLVTAEELPAWILRDEDEASTHIYIVLYSSAKC